MGFSRDMDTLREKLSEENKRREEVLDRSREVVRSSGSAIIGLHRGKVEEADRLIGEARELLSSLESLLEESERFRYSGSVMTAYQEFCEALLLRGYVKEKRIITPSEVDLPPEAYVLGSADFIGELRRLVVDSIISNQLEEALNAFNLMEEIYHELLSTLYAAPNTRGLRRKCDIARGLVERTRGDVALEQRRSRLEDRLKGFEEEAGKSSKGTKGV